MIRLSFIFIFCLVFQAQAAYQYTYIPKETTPKIYSFLSRSWKKCKVGEKNEYPKKKGACTACPKGFYYLVNEVKGKAGCYKCPHGTLLASKNGYPLCLSIAPVVGDKAIKATGEEVSFGELELLSFKLSANYKTRLPTKDKEEKQTFKNKTKLINTCEATYPEDKEAQHSVEVCKKLVQENDFLCPHVGKNIEGLWRCKACPKNLPYQNRQGHCFACPYAEGKELSKNGEEICQSEIEKEK